MPPYRMTSAAGQFRTRPKPGTVQGPLRDSARHRSKDPRNRWGDIASRNEAAEQRAFFIEKHAGRDSTLEGLPIDRHEKIDDTDSLFARFAGIFHAFGALGRHIEAAITEKNPRDAELRLCGAKYDSLPSLLEKTIEDSSWDPVVRYVTFLCAQQYVMASYSAASYGSTHAISRPWS